VKKKSVIVNKDYDPFILQTILKRHWWWPLLFVSFFLSVAFVILRYTKSSYESSLVLQIEFEDKGKEVFNVENINRRQTNLSSYVELMRSQYLFEKAVKLINYNVSIFSKGKVLTEERYNASNFHIVPYQLKDSSLVSVPINVDYDGQIVSLSYLRQGKNFALKGKLNQHLENQHMEVVVKATAPKEFEADASQNELHFTFNSISSFAAKYLSYLDVAPLDPVANTIQVTVRGHNPQLCYDLALAVANTFIDNYDETQLKSSENILSFVNQQLDSLGGVLRDSKDSLRMYQLNTKFSDMNGAELSLSQSITEFKEERIIVEDEIRTLVLMDRKMKDEPNRLDVYRLLPELIGKSFEQTLAPQIQGLFDLLEKKEDLMYRVTEENPDVKTINKKVNVKISTVQRNSGFE